MSRFSKKNMVAHVKQTQGSKAASKLLAEGWPNIADGMTLVEVGMLFPDVKINQYWLEGAVLPPPPKPEKPKPQIKYISQEVRYTYIDLCNVINKSEKSIRRLANKDKMMSTDQMKKELLQLAHKIISQLTEVE
jgi:hypothetical protein